MRARTWRLTLAWQLSYAALACGGDVTAPPAPSASSAAARDVAAAKVSASSNGATLPSSAAAPTTGSATPGRSSSAATSTSVGPIAQMKAHAATHPGEYLSKPIKVDGVHVRTTTRTHGGGEHPLYRYIVVMIADAPGAQPVLACEMQNWAPPADLKPNDPVTIEGRGSAMAGLPGGYDLIVGSCKVTRRD